MKHKISYLSIIFFLILSKVTFSQVAINIEDMSYINGTPINSCGLIDFEDNSSVSLNLYVKLSKPLGLAIGDSNIKIYTKKSASTYELSRYTQTVLSNSWSESNGQNVFYVTFPVSLDAIEFNVSGGFLYASLEYSNGLSIESCNYPIGKDEVPTFEIIPNSTSVYCLVDSPKTFTVDNVNDSPGTLTYNWEVGIGWNNENGNSVSNFTTSTNTIDLTPYQFPPSHVKVTPVLDGVSYPKLTSTVSLAPFSTTAAITGNSSLCSTASYSVNNLPSGVSVTSWSVSDGSIATISSNGNQATLTATGNGTISITANLTNACGQTKPIVKNNIYVGAPDFSPYPAISGDNSPLTGEYLWYSVDAANGANSYDWYFDMGNGVTGTHVGGWEILQYGYQNRSIFVKVGNPGTTVLVCRANNNCGNRLKYKYVAVRSVNSPCEGELKFSSNPMKKGNRDNNVIYPPIDPCDFDPYNKIATNKKIIKTVEIFNSYGESVYLKSQTDDKFNVSELKKGLYIVKSQMPNGETITKKLIIQ